MYAGIDRGSTSIKVALYDENLKLIDRRSRPVVYIRDNGFVEFDALKYAEDLAGLLADMTRANGIKEIKEMAFTGCTDMEVLEILRTTEEFEIINAESKASGETDKPVIIDNARTMQQGEIMTLTTKKYDDDAVRVIKWSSSSTNVTVNADTGEVKAINTGEATIKAELRDNPSIYAEVKINIVPVNQAISIAANSLNRCNSLSELKIYASNPNSIKITNGTALNLNDKVKIIVPKGSKAMYQTHETWSKYSSQIIEME